MRAEDRKEFLRQIEIKSAKFEIANCREKARGYAEELEEAGREVSVETLRDMFIERGYNGEFDIFRLDEDYTSIRMAIDFVMEERGKKLQDMISSFVKRADEYAKELKDNGKDVDDKTLYKKFEEVYKDKGERGAYELVIDKGYIRLAIFQVTNGRDR